MISSEKLPVNLAVQAFGFGVGGWREFQRTEMESEYIIDLTDSSGAFNLSVINFEFLDSIRIGVHSNSLIFYSGSIPLKLDDFSPRYSYYEDSSGGSCKCGMEPDGTVFKKRISSYRIAISDVEVIIDSSGNRIL